MARKGYTTAAAQAAANKRYMENNEGAKEKRRRRSYKAAGKKFILELADCSELSEYESFIAERRAQLKKEES